MKNNESRNQNKHTPGPWSVTGNEIRKSEGVPMLLATINNSESAKINGYNAEANGKLIASAPDLFKALIRAKERIEYDNNPSQSEYCKSVLREINEAIKKATE